MDEEKMTDDWGLLKACLDGEIREAFYNGAEEFHDKLVALRKKVKHVMDTIDRESAKQS